MKSSLPPAAESHWPPQFFTRPAESHKGDYGRALIVGGSLGMSGAVVLAGRACLRTGAGLVTLAVPECCQQVVAQGECSYMTIALPSDAAGRLTAAAATTIAERATSATAVALGPGLGRSAELVELVAWLYTTLEQPLVVDADALYALAQRREVLGSAAGPRLLTPHEGELRRLLAGTAEPRQPPASGSMPGTTRAELEQAAIELVRQINQPSDRHSAGSADRPRVGQSVVVLKGHRTLVTDGVVIHRNTTGNPGMATGGSGDVLTGILTALLCQKFAPLRAACCGAELHGLAGDLATDKLTQPGLIASDLVEYLPEALGQLTRPPG